MRSRLLSVWTARGPILVLRNDFVAISDLEVKLMQWYHLCFAYEYSSGDYVMLLNGDVVDKGVHDKRLQESKRK